MHLEGSWKSCGVQRVVTADLVTLVRNSLDPARLQGS